MRARALPVLAVALVVMLLITAVVAIVRLARPVPPPHLSLAVPAQVIAAPGQPPAIPLPSTGSLAVSSPVGGQLAAVDAATPRPIGSVAKAMTALVALEARPLNANADGPSYVITANDVAIYRQTLEAGGSSVAVSTGEAFTERQLLLALMLPSANNLAETLALWISGDRTKFLERLNQRAVQLGMAHTHFDDPTGFLDTTVSSAADLVLLGNAVLENSALAAIVATRSATLPDGAVVENLDSNLSQPGWLGIKTGSTNAAGGCLLFAAQREPSGGGDPVRVVGAILGQPALGDALRVALDVTNTALDGFARVDLATLPIGITGTVTTDWGDASTVRAVATATPLTVRLGAVLMLTSEDLALSAPLAAGVPVAQVRGSLGGRVVVTFTVQAADTVGSPGLRWRLSH